MTDQNRLDYIDDPNRTVYPKKNGYRLMTYNVHGFTDIKHRKKFDEIINTIEMIDPDVLILEEVYIRKRNETVHETVLIEHLMKIGLKYYAFSKCGINMICSKYEIDSFEIDLGRDPIKRLKRNAIVCVFPNQIALQDLVIVGTHLDVFDESGKTRTNQINLITNTLQKQLHQYNKSKIIIAGDFNSLRKADYTPQEWDMLVADDVKRGVDTIEDVVPILEQKNFIESFTYCKKRLPVSVWSKRRVDYIFGKSIDFKQTEAYRTTISDHYPIYSDFI